MTRKKSTPKPRKRQDSVHINKVGTFTFWEKPEEGMSGGSYTPLPLRTHKPRRKPEAKTLDFIDEMAKLLALGQKTKARKLAAHHWPKVSPERAWAYWGTIKSYYLPTFDAAFAKYRSEYVTG